MIKSIDPPTSRIPRTGSTSTTHPRIHSSSFSDNAASRTPLSLSFSSLHLPFPRLAGEGTAEVGQAADPTITAASDSRFPDWRGSRPPRRWPSSLQFLPQKSGQPTRAPEDAIPAADHVTEGRRRLRGLKQIVTSSSPPPVPFPSLSALHSNIIRQGRLPL